MNSSQAACREAVQCVTIAAWYEPVLPCCAHVRHVRPVNSIDAKDGYHLRGCQIHHCNRSQHVPHHSWQQRSTAGAEGLVPMPVCHCHSSVSMHFASWCMKLQTTNTQKPTWKCICVLLPGPSSFASSLVCNNEFSATYPMSCSPMSDAWYLM